MRRTTSRCARVANRRKDSRFTSGSGVKQDTERYTHYAPSTEKLEDAITI